jgi:hypothetical protein
MILIGYYTHFSVNVKTGSFIVFVGRRSRLDSEKMLLFDEIGSQNYNLFERILSYMMIGKYAVREQKALLLTKTPLLERPGFSAQDV